MIENACHIKRGRFQINTFLKRLIFGALSLSLTIPAYAGNFSVTPVRIYMTPNDKAVAVTINNQGDDDLVMQADVYSWSQTPDGKDELTLTDDLLLSPPIIKLAGKSRQVVRLARLTRMKPDRQITYRLVVREIPEARPVKDRVQLQLALAFSMPVFITPRGAKSNLVCSAERTSASSVSAACENTGTAYAQPLDFVLSNSVGEKLASRDSGGYILPTIKRKFDIKSAGKRIPGGKATLTVRLDDGSKQTFDVTLSE